MTTAIESDASRYWELRGKLEDLINDMRDEADTATMPRARQLRVDANALRDVIDSIN